MLCPGCKIEYRDGDIFCPGCGLDLRIAASICPVCGAQLKADDKFCPNCGSKVGVSASKEAQVAARPAGAEEAGTVLTREFIQQIADSFECNYLSPLSSLCHGKKKERVGESPIDEALLQVILKPEKAFYLTAMTREKSSQKGLLIKNGACYRWVDEDGRVVITREESSRKFLDSIRNDVTRNITEAESSLLMLKREQLDILKGVYSLCHALTEMKVVPAFTNMDQLKSLLGSSEEIIEQVRELSRQGLIRLIGYDNPIITIEARGEEIAGALVDYDVYYTIQVLTEGVDAYPSFHLLARGSRLYMVTNPNNGEDIIFRTLDASGFRSLIDWAWLADLAPENTAPGMESAEKTAAAAVTGDISCSQCGGMVRSDAAFCPNCGAKL